MYQCRIKLTGNDMSCYSVRKGMSSSHASYSYDSSMDKNTMLAILKENYFSLYIVGCGCAVLLSHLLGIQTPSVDKMIAMTESIIMGYLGGPSAVALAKVLLQTRPDFIQSSVEHNLRMVINNRNTCNYCF